MTVGVKALPMLEEEAKKRKVELGREAALKQHGRVGKKIYQPFHSEAEGRAREHAARLVGVSPQYIAQGKMIQKKGPELFEQIEQGKISISQAMSLLRRNEEKKQREKQMINTDIDLRKGDFKKVLANLGEIDVIITDPPYAKKYLILFSELGAFAQAKLKLDGFLAVYSGQYHLPEVIGCLSEHLTYVWTFCLYHKGEKQLVNGVNIMCGWKPILIFSKGRRKMRFSAYDVIVSEKAEKFSHRWQQSESGAKTLVEILSLPDELVVDPFAGTGTILKAASELGRRGIGATL
jgi:DNA modification methylase